MYQFWKIDFSRPLEATGKCFVLVCVISFAVAFATKKYSKTDIFGVLGVTGRRAAEAAIEELEPAGDAFVNMREGKGFVLPATPSQDNED